MLRNDHWHKVSKSYFLAQLAGIVEGYSAAMKGKNPVSMADILTMNVFWRPGRPGIRLLELKSVLIKFWARDIAPALIRLLPGNSLTF